MFPTHSGAGRSQERSRGYRAARIIRITLAVTSFPVGWRKQGLEWFAERNTHFYQALKRSLLMPRFQGYGVCYAHTHMCQGLPRPLHAPINAHRSGTAQAGRFHFRASTQPLMAQRHRQGLNPQGHAPINVRRSRTGQAGRFHFRVSTKPLAAQRHRQGLNPQGEVRMSIPCAATMSQALCFWVPFTDEDTEAGRWLLRYPVDLDIGGAIEFIRVCSLKKLLNLFPMRYESQDSWIHTFHK